MAEQFGHGWWPGADKLKIKTAEACATDTTLRGKGFDADGNAITREHYAAAYAVGFPRTACFLLSRGCSPALAEEIAQAAWARGWEHHSKLREPEKVVHWVNTIAFNLFRSEFRRREVTVLTPDVPMAPQTGPGAIDAQRILAQCSPTERTLLHNHYSAGYTSAEIAQRMNCSAITVRVRLMRLRRRLQMVMTAEPVSALQVCA
jgi:DNA-directed RNA polymerase specialized sigma24 family protein